VRRGRGGEGHRAAGEAERARARKRVGEKEDGGAVVTAAAAPFRQGAENPAHGKWGLLPSLVCMHYAGR